jgi:hypothetical protein
MNSSKGYSELQVLKSAAGYYIGRLFTDEEGFTQPGSRESAEYYGSAMNAEHALINYTFTKRDHP